jgi:hypothetical protein
MTNKKYNPESTTTTRVHLDNEFNSTPFTDCCDTAAINEERCPGCGNIVQPENPNHRFRSAYARGY